MGRGHVLIFTRALDRISVGGRAANVPSPPLVLMKVGYRAARWARSYLWSAAYRIGTPRVREIAA